MKLRERHGRKDAGGEYFEYQVMLPTVVAQRHGQRWIIGITHTDGTTQILLYLDREADAKCQARRLAQRYATAEHYSVEEDVKLAKAFAEKLQAARASGTEA
jgi:erythromycin esterase-like protein